MKNGWAVGLAAVVAIGAVGLAWNMGKLPFGPALLDRDTLPEASPVSLLLLQPISSGGTDEGTKVPALVEKDVLGAEGKVAIPAGAVAMVEVVQSRGATPFTQFVNQPARLSIRFLSVQAVGGEVRLRPGERTGDEEFALTRANTEGPDLADLAESVGKNKELRDSWKGALDQLQSKGAVDLRAPDLRKVLEGVATEMALPATAETLRSDRSWQALADVAARAKGGDLTGLAGSDALLALTALKEVAHLAGSMDRTLRGIFKGRNIEAPMGTRLTGYTAEEHKFEVPRKG